MADDRPRDRMRWWALCEITSAMLILEHYPHATDTAKRMRAAEDVLDLLDYLEMEEHKKLMDGHIDYHKIKRAAKKDAKGLDEAPNLDRG